MSVEDKRLICKVCLRQYARYTCPRCNTSSCSLACYKSHSSTCTETFYQEQTVAQLRCQKTDSAGRRATLALLERVYRSQIDDDTADLSRLSLGGGDGDEEEEEEEDGHGHEGNDDDENDDDGNNENALHSDPMYRFLRDVLSEETIHRILEKAASQGVSLEIEAADLTPEEWEAFQAAVDRKGEEGAEAAGAEVEGGRDEVGAHHEMGGMNLDLRNNGSHKRGDPCFLWWEGSDARELCLSAHGLPLVYSTGGRGGGGEEAAEEEERKEEEGEKKEKKKREVDKSSFSKLDENEEKYLPLPLAALERLPPLSSLTKAPPSPQLAHHLVELLYGYCFVMRHFNGRIHVNNPENGPIGKSASQFLERHLDSKLNPVTMAAMHMLFALTSVLETPTTQMATTLPLPTSTHDACVESITRGCVPPIGDLRHRAQAVQVLEDVATLLGTSRSCIILALCDLRKLTEEGRAMWSKAAKEAVAEVAEIEKMIRKEKEREKEKEKEREIIREEPEEENKKDKGKDRNGRIDKRQNGTMTGEGEEEEEKGGKNNDNYSGFDDENATCEDEVNNAYLLHPRAVRSRNPRDSKLSSPSRNNSRFRKDRKWDPELFRKEVLEGKLISAKKHLKAKRHWLSQVDLARRKLLFFTCWVNESDEWSIESLAMAVADECVSQKDIMALQLPKCGIEALLRGDTRKQEHSNKYGMADLEFKQNRSQGFSESLPKAMINHMDEKKEGKEHNDENEQATCHSNTQGRKGQIYTGHGENRKVIMSGNHTMVLLEELD